MENSTGERGDGGEVAASAKRHSKIRKRSKRWEVGTQSTSLSSNTPPSICSLQPAANVLSLLCLPSAKRKGGVGVIVLDLVLWWWPLPSNVD